MPYVATAYFSAGTSKAGLTDLSVQPYAGITSIGPAITIGIVAVGSGMYDFAGQVPDTATSGRLISVSKGVLDSQPFGGKPATPGQGSAVAVLPLALDVVARTFAANGVHKLALACVQGEAKTWLFAITDSAGDPVDLTGHDLRFVVRDANFADVFKAESGDGVDLTADNVVRVMLTPEQTDRRGGDGDDYAGHWTLWDLTTDTCLGRGAFKIAAAVKDVGGE